MLKELEVEVVTPECPLRHRSLHSRVFFFHGVQCLKELFFFPFFDSGDSHRHIGFWKSNRIQFNIGAFIVQGIVHMC